MLDLSLLGTGGMIPLPHRLLTALLARCNGHMLLIDCGEGTQVAMRKLGWGFVDLDVILFTHFHADHIAGLPGLLLSLSNYGRTELVTIVGPKGIAEVVNSLRVIAPELQYEIKFIELDFETREGLPTIRFQLGDFHLSALTLSHALPCIGYRIDLPRTGKFDPERAKAQNVPMQYWSRLQKGETIFDFTPEMVMGDPRMGIRVSYITDTRPIDTIPNFIEGSDLFVCEGMYGDDAYKEKAERFYHMIFSDAAKLAKAGHVKELWLTHYSQALTDPKKDLSNAKAIFQNSIAGVDCMTTSLKFEE